MLEVRCLHCMTSMFSLRYCGTGTSTVLYRWAGVPSAVGRLLPCVLGSRAYTTVEHGPPPSAAPLHLLADLVGDQGPHPRPATPQKVLRGHRKAALRGQRRGDHRHGFVRGRAGAAQDQDQARGRQRQRGEVAGPGGYRTTAPHGAWVAAAAAAGQYCKTDGWIGNAQQDCIGCGLHSGCCLEGHADSY